MRYVLFILCIFIMLSSGGSAELQDNDPFRYTIEPGFDNFSEWQKNLDLAPIYYQLSPFVPEGYIITAVESSCWYDSKYPQFWIIGMSYNHPVVWGPEPSILQVWRPPSESSKPKLIQEFQWERSYIQDINWISEGDELFLYVVAQEVTNSNLLCFKIIKGEPKLRLVSEQDSLRGPLWLIRDLSPWGSVFVNIEYMHYGENPTGFMGNNPLSFITLTDKGFFLTHYIFLWDLMTKPELDSIRNSEEIQGAITFKLLLSPDWRENIREGTYWGDYTIFKRKSIDGLTYYTDVGKEEGDWKEVPVG